MIWVLEEARIELVVVGGTALAFGSYRSPALRHCHNIDLLVAPPLLERSREALGRDFDCQQEDERLLVRHPSGNTARAWCPPPSRLVRPGAKQLRPADPSHRGRRPIRANARACRSARPGVHQHGVGSRPGPALGRRRGAPRPGPRARLGSTRRPRAARSVRSATAPHSGRTSLGEGVRHLTRRRPRAATGRRPRTGRQTRARRATSGPSRLPESSPWFAGLSWVPREITDGTRSLDELRGSREQRLQMGRAAQCSQRARRTAYVFALATTRSSACSSSKSRPSSSRPAAGWGVGRLRRCRDLRLRRGRRRRRGHARNRGGSD